MIVTKNLEAMDRKHTLMRAVNNGNVSREQYDEEMALLEPFIKRNLAAALLKCETELKSEINVTKRTISLDGDFKRTIARMLIKFLSTDLTQDEIRGIFRQGYKIQRLK